MLAQDLSVKQICEDIIEEVLGNVMLITDSAIDFELAQRELPSRRMVVRNNMDYLLTVAEDRRNKLTLGGDDLIRLSVKDNYLKFFKFEKKGAPLDISGENFEVCPTLGVHGDEDNSHRIIVSGLEKNLS